MQELLLLYSLMPEDFFPPTIPLVRHSPEFFGKTNTVNLPFSIAIWDIMIAPFQKTSRFSPDQLCPCFPNPLLSRKHKKLHAQRCSQPPAKVPTGSSPAHASGSRIKSPFPPFPILFPPPICFSLFFSYKENLLSSFKISFRSSSSLTDSKGMIGG